MFATHRELRLVVLAAFPALSAPAGEARSDALTDGAKAFIQNMPDEAANPGPARLA